MKSGGVSAGSKGLCLSEKRQIIEQTGLPSYLYDQLLNPAYDTKGKPIPDASYVSDVQISKEIISVYEQVYKSAKTNLQKNKVLRSFFGIAPHVAFKPGVWSMFIWRNEVAARGKDKAAERTLEVIARAITTDTFYENRTNTTTLIVQKRSSAI